MHFKTLENNLKYTFNNINLLLEALSHPSLKQNTNKNYKNINYERMELLGDTIINFIITEILLKKYFNYSEGKIAKIKSYLISKELLCKIGKKLNIANYMIMTKGEENVGGRSNLNNIENTMEAIIAAIYLDSNIYITNQIIYNLWNEHLIITNLNNYDPKSTLQELVQKYGFNIPIYNILKKTGQPHSPIFTISCLIKYFNKSYHAIATGNNIKEAEKDAARKLINILNKHINNNLLTK